MQASHVSYSTLLEAAAEIGVTLDISALSSNRFRVKLNPSGPSSWDRKYQRWSPSSDPNRNDRLVHAICWHGFRDFFRAVYRNAPDATFRTSLATWHNSAHFEANFEDSGDLNAGNRSNPCPWRELCECTEEQESR
jgi:hypothetical protein